MELRDCGSVTSFLHSRCWEHTLRAKSSVAKMDPK